MKKNTTIPRHFKFKDCTCAIYGTPPIVTEIILGKCHAYLMEMAKLNAPATYKKMVLLENIQSFHSFLGDYLNTRRFYTIVLLLFGHTLIFMSIRDMLTWEYLIYNDILHPSSMGFIGYTFIGVAICVWALFWHYAKLKLESQFFWVKKVKIYVVYWQDWCGCEPDKAFISEEKAKEYLKTEYPNLEEKYYVNYLKEIELAQ